MHGHGSGTVEPEHWKQKVGAPRLKGNLENLAGNKWKQAGKH